MKILYITDSRVPTEKTHGLQIFKMCEAFVLSGSRDTQISTQKNAEKNYSVVYDEGKNLRESASIEVELVVPRRFNIKELKGKDPFEFYGVKKIFKVRKLPCIDLNPWNTITGQSHLWIRALTFSPFAILYILFKNPDIIYTRDRFFLLFLAPIFRKKICYESHRFPEGGIWFYKILIKKLIKLVTITEGLKNKYITEITDKDILVAPDGVDMEMFDVDISKEEARQKLGLPQDKKIILYTGHLYKWKGVHALALSARYFTQDMLLYFAGGADYSIEEFKEFVRKENLKNIVILGRKSHLEMPIYLKAADCLALTGTKEYKISQYYTSPLKMFEYMVSFRPIVASNLPSFREVLDDDNSILVDADDPKSLALGIKQALDNQKSVERIVSRAYDDVKKYTWLKRAEKIINYIYAHTLHNKNS